jgi:nucleoside 2-deoxyribosyltransferase
MSERTPKDYAIEHAGYLADAVEYALKSQTLVMDADDWLALNSRVYEFRKRDAKAKRDEMSENRMEPTITVPSRAIRVYTASNLSEAPRWRDLVEEWPEVKFVARWPFKHVGTVPDEPVYAKVFWDHDLEDVASCDVVLVYAEPGQKLRGALVEAGMALALHKRVIVVGDHDDYSTWRYHKNVYIAADLAMARFLLATMAM